jgi:hypothetical protein
LALEIDAPFTRSDSPPEGDRGPLISSSAAAGSADATNAPTAIAMYSLRVIGRISVCLRAGDLQRWRETNPSKEALFLELALL